MTIKNTNGDVFTVDSTIVVPQPMDNDTWETEFITQIDDIDDDGYIYFCDDDWCGHKIDKERVRLFDPEIHTL